MGTIAIGKFFAPSRRRRTHLRLREQHPESVEVLKGRKSNPYQLQQVKGPPKANSNKDYLALLPFQVVPGLSEVPLKL